MNEPYSPNLFLFQSYVAEVLKEGKKIIKSAPFDGLDPDVLLNNNKNQHMDEYHQYFLSAMGHLRTRELACINYQKLIRQALIDRDHMPPSLISSVLTACAGAGLAGGSTSGSSSLGSASLASSPQGHSLYIGNMIKTMLLNTSQPSSELTQGLNYLLEGTRKKYSMLYNAMLQQVYNGLLIRYRDPPLKIFLTNYLDMLIDEIEIHIEDPDYIFATRKLNEETQKADMPLFKEEHGYGKFGKCFSCRKEANHYLKQEWLPICGLGCRQKAKALIAECQQAEPFSLVGWILDHLPTGDQAILTFLFRQLQHSLDKQTFSGQQIMLILKTLIHQLGSNTMSKPLASILSLLMTRWERVVPLKDITAGFRQTIEHYFKVYLLEVLTIIEEAPIAKELEGFVMLLCQILRNDEILVRLFVNYDSKFFEAPILARMLNLISQYAKKFQTPLQGLANIVKSLMSRIVTRNIRDDHWKDYGQFIKKRQTRKIITTFNKKPNNGIKMLQKLLENSLQQGKIISQSPIPESESPAKEKAFETPEKERERLPQLPNRDQVQGADDEGYIPREPCSQGQKLEEEGYPEPGFTIKEEEMFDSDQIIHKRIGQLIEEHPSAEAIEEAERIEQSQKVEISTDKEEVASVRKEEEHPVSEDKKQTTLELQSTHHHRQIRSESQFSPQKPKQVDSLSPREIALFIRQNLQVKSWTQSDSKLPIPIPMLSKAKVGEYFGTDSSLTRKVSMEFLNQFNFEKVEIDDVMRIVMNSYSLPKETQQIERIIGDLSLKLLGKYGFEDDTSIYQYIYLLLMVQTTNHNPQVRDNEKLSLQNHLSMCKHVKGGVAKERAEADYKRILSNSLVVKMKFPEEAIFYQKYVTGQPLRKELYDNEEGSLTRSLLAYLWEYLVIGLVLPGNNRGLLQTTILLGREGLEDQQKGFFQALRKCPPEESEPQMLKIAIEYGNYLIGKPWDAIVSLLYSLQQNNDCSAVLDRLFTNSGQITPPRMRDILQSLLQFSTSEFRKDTHYTRELFVLRHINSLIQYNINRFDVLAPLCWPLIRSYFRDICLHPRKEISMPAVDSLKQLALKLVKLRIEAVPHQALLETFLHVFQRSGVQMKDLIANVLLNLITSDLRGGWDVIYSILDVLDTKDKQLVVKLNARLISEVGLHRLGNLPRLHGICIKQLRICGDPAATEQLLSQLWDLSSYIDEADTWLQTIRSIKDIFKISLNPDIMNIFIRLANQCIIGVQASRQQGPRSLDREVLAEVMDVLLFLLELRGSSKTAALIATLDAISTLQINFLFKYLVGNCGLLQIFRMFLSGEQKIGFCIFFKKIVKDVLIPNIKNGYNDPQFQYLGYWCVHQYMNHLPIEVLNMKDKDKDFEQTLTALLTGPELTEGPKQDVLIEFHLSNKDYYQKSLIHLIFLDIIENIYRRLKESTMPKAGELRDKIELAVKESFDCAFRVNRLILLRNFLWNNGFIAGRNLPGLLKQEHRTFVASVRLFALQKVYPMMKLYFVTFKETLTNLNKLKQLYEPSRPDLRNLRNLKAPQQDSKEKQYSRGLYVYAKDCGFWIAEAEGGICQSLRMLKLQLQNARQNSFILVEDKTYLIGLFLSILELNNLSSSIFQNIVQVLHTLYSIAL